MKVDLEKLIEHARSISKEKRLEELDQILEKEPAEIAIILNKGSTYPFQKLREDKKKVQEYYITGIYDLGVCEKYPLDVLFGSPNSLRNFISVMFKVRFVLGMIL